MFNLKSSFVPQQRAALYKLSGRTVDGEPILEYSSDVHFSPVRLDMSIGKSSVRTDKSGTQGRAEEEMFDGRILVHPEDFIKFNDVLEILGKKFQVVGIFPRFDMASVLHHYQVDLMSWD